MPPKPRTWDARLARQMIMPLVNTRVTPNHLTTVRLIVGLACAYAFSLGGYMWGNVGALLLVASNVIDHADGELARVSGKTSRIGHFYDLAADALVTILLFVGVGAGVAATSSTGIAQFGIVAGTVAGISVAAIFLMRLQIEEIAGKSGTAQPSWGGFEIEDILYLMPLVTLFNGLQSFLTLATVGAPAFALWVAVDFLRVLRRRQAASSKNSLPVRHSAKRSLMRSRKQTSKPGSKQPSRRPSGQTSNQSHKQPRKQGAQTMNTSMANTQVAPTLSAADATLNKPTGRS